MGFIMRILLRTRMAALHSIVMAALILVAIFPAAVGKADPAPSLSYTVIPQAYNNTLKVANATDMQAPRIVVCPDPTSNGAIDVYVIGVDGSPCANLVTVRSRDGGVRFGAPQKAPLCVGSSAVDAVVAPNGTL